MVLEAVIRIPEAPSAEYRRTVLSLAAREGEETCLRCGVDRFHLLDALLDSESWENRGLAASIIGGCRICRHEVAGIVAEAMVILTCDGNKAVKSSHSHERI